MRYSINFTSGELAGKSFPLVPDKLLSIGRSSTSDVKLSSKDISPKHLTIRLSKSNVAVIEVFSTRITTHNGKSLSMGDSVEMAVNDTVQLGTADMFTLVSMAGEAPAADDDEMKTTIKPMAPVPPPSNDDDEMKTTIRPMAPVPPPSGNSQTKAPSNDDQSTRNDIKPPARVTAPKPAPAKPAPPPKSAPAKPAKASGGDAPKASGGGETVAIQTLLASDEELDKIKSSFQSKHRRKTGIWVVIVAFFLALCVSIYIITRPEHEDQLT
ncbi:MAG: FHA domain-containing protein [Victivallales bacterium]|nr:FHA domain-containing protein [Victivallales bacterium]